MNCWKMLRRGRSLRIDVEPSAIANAEEDEIVGAVEAEAADHDLDVVHVTGSILVSIPAGTVGLIRRIGAVADRHGKRIRVGPI